MKSKHKYSFDNFILSKSNEFAFAVAKSVAESPGMKFNPAYFYSPTGTGKTHLLNAIAYVLFKKEKNSRIDFFSSEDFNQNIIRAICKEKLERFKERLREKKAVLIEDIQFFEGKPYIQELLSSILADLTERRIQIILTGNVFTGDLDFIKSLNEWLESGIFANVGKPDVELRRDFLCTALNKNKLWAKDEVRIPDQSDQRFRSKLTTRSGRN